MKVFRLPAVLAGVCLFILGSVCPVYPGQPPITVQEIVLLEQTWADAVFRADLPALERILSDNVTYIHGTGNLETKQHFINSLRSGDRKYFPLILEDLNVRVFPEAAVVTGRYNLRLLSKGREISNVNRYTHMYVRTPEGLRLVAHQATNVPPPK
jgi:ketosteroid isomerase-like protein